MKLVLFRHGPAGRRNSRRWPDDALRPLTPRGEERTRAAACGLRRLLGDGPVSIVTSPLARSARTAELLRDCFRAKDVEACPLLVPGGPFRPVLAMLKARKSGETVILVGHEPDLGRLAGTLLFGAPSPLPLRKAGACVLEIVGAIEPGKATLQGFYPPRVLRRLAGRKVEA